MSDATLPLSEWFCTSELEPHTFIKHRVHAFKHGVLAFKNRVQAFKHRVLAFKNRVQAFKHRVQEFKHRVQARSRERRWAGLSRRG